MRLDQFEKLKRMVNLLIENQRETRMKLVHLERENVRLKSELERCSAQPEGNETPVHKQLEKENEKLKQKQAVVSEQLKELVSQLELSYTKHSGVDS